MSVAYAFDHEDSPSVGGDLVPRATVEQICAYRRAALEAFEAYHAALVDAKNAQLVAIDWMRKAAPSGVNRYNAHNEEARRHWLTDFDVPDHEKFTVTARRMVDTDIWSHLIEFTELERLMDKTAKDEFAQQLKDDPPEAIEDNVYATLRQFMADAGAIWKRGIAECFSNLDRRFRSHDGWKIGSRVILPNAFGEWGHWNHHRSHRDTIMDIERVFYMLDGRQPPEIYCGVIQVIDEARKADGVQLAPRQTEVESEFFTIRIYMNGNAHVWFRRDDLVEKVNKLLGEYYGEAIPQDRDVDDTEDIFTPKTTPARRYGFFPTPERAAALLTDRVPVYRPKEGEPPARVLEPSAGTGNLSRILANRGAVVDCVEVQPHLAENLDNDGIYGRVTCCDFLLVRPDPDNLYDAVVMNPPFDLERDIDHVMHAMKFLKPDGSLHAIMSAGTEFRETRKAKAFRALMDEKNASWRDLPSGSFSTVGTNVNTVILRFNNNGSESWW